MDDHEQHCLTCPVTDTTQQNQIIDAAIQAAYLDPSSPTSLRAIASMLPAWLKADHKRVGRRLKALLSTGALPQLSESLGVDGKSRRFRLLPKAVIPEDFRPRIKMICGDSLTELKRLQDDSVDCCVTSPPYYRQMDINAEEQIGQEPTADQYIEKLTDIFSQVRRILRRQGTLWINVADTYRDGAALLIPQRLAIALTQNGWKLRAEIVIEKANPAPRRHEGRPTPSHETLFLFSLCVPHYFDPDPLRGDHSENNLDEWSLPEQPGPARGTVWRIPPVRHAVGGHPAVMSVELARDCILAGCHPGGTVLDPFSGIGTTLLACAENYRHAIGIELSPYYANLAKNRFSQFALA